MYIIGRMLIRALALLYLAMSVIGFLGYFGVEKYSANLFSFFDALLGKYSIILPIICLIFTVVCWKISKSLVKGSEENDHGEDWELASETEDEDEDDIPAFLRGRVLSEPRKRLEGRKRPARADESPRYYNQRPRDWNGFPAYFAQDLPVKDQRVNSENNHENLGTNFSTYFGEGKNNIYLPAKTVQLQGFKDYFRKDHFAERSSRSSDRTIRPTPQAQRSGLPWSDRTTAEPRQESLRPRIIESIQRSESLSRSSSQASDGRKGWRLPKVDLLNSVVRNEYKTEQHNPKLLEEVLSNFGVTAKVINISVGPVITRYELSPAPGTKISKITGLTDDIALALASREIRIEAPIPGKAAIGIEIPRSNPQTVFFREVIDSEGFRKNSSKLKVALGKGIADQPVLAELEKMPHLLVAGATGSGKSIFINGLINSLLFGVTPDEVKLLLIDPKVVELSQYNGIPHLLAPVVTDPRKANKYLKQIIKEMENRYELFAAHGVRDITHFNKEAESSQNSQLPFIVVIIDELADLMMVASNEIEEAICRLAQMARAAGIHLVLATQRPSVNVITGLIKANIPSRISFAVSSQIDSRTILDCSGAEKLLGRGDMLYSPIGLNKPMRVHGCFIDEQEIKRVIEYWQSQGRPEYGISEEQLQEITTEEKNSEEFDDRFREAGELVISTGVASVSFLQRRLKVGYSRAARLMDMLEEAGVVGGYEGNKPRDILMSLESFSNQHCS